MRPALVVFCVIALSCVSGCGRVARIRECRALGALVNGSLTAIEAKARPKTAAAYRSAARGYLELAKQVRAVRISEAVARGTLEEYAAMLDAVAPAAEAYAVALETHDPQQVEQALRGLERFQRHERSLVARIDAYCHAP
jgi:hypothetical protein